MSEQEQTSDGALAGVDRRLADVLDHWQQAEWFYFEPERFRIAIQTAIQTLRTVTFLLQNQKRIIPDFEAWYKGWQDRLKADALMRWMVDARNKIEKQGDLEMHSYVRAEIIASFIDDGPRIDVPARLFDNLEALLDSIPEGDLAEHIADHGILKIQRRWVENTLPDHELLEAVAVAFGRISELIDDAHAQMGERDRSAGAPAGLPPCMIGHEDSRSVLYDLATGEEVEKTGTDVVIDEDRIAELERFGDPFEASQRIDASSDEKFLLSLFGLYRHLLLADGAAASMILLLRQGQPVGLLGLEAESHAERYVLMRRAAQEVRAADADAVVAFSEVWSAPADPLKPLQRAVDSPRRREALCVRMVSTSGEPLEVTAEIRREGETLSLGEPHLTLSSAMFLFAPIYEAWKRPIPEAWTAALGGFKSDSSGPMP